MKRQLWIATALAALVVGLVPVAASAQNGAAKDPQMPSGVASLNAAVCEWPVNTTNAYLQTKTVTSSDARYYTSTAWTDLECGALTVTVPKGMKGGLVVRADGELTCTGPAVDETQWCQGRVLVNGLDAFPREFEADGSFAWAQSSADAAAWESNVFTRSMTLTCPENSTNNVCSWDVKVQVRNHANNLTFRVDGSTVEAQLTYA